MNGKLRQRGYRPVPFGQSSLRDTVKYPGGAGPAARRSDRPEPSHDHDH